MTFHVERIDHVVLRVRDLAGMVRFYEQALGFKVERTIDRLSLVQMRAGASMLDLVKGERPPSGGNMDHLCFRIEPFDRSNIESRLRRSALRLAKRSSVTGRKALACRCISTIPKATRSNSKARQRCPRRLDARPLQMIC